jgi:hypothetical protein
MSRRRRSFAAGQGVEFMRLLAQTWANQGAAVIEIFWGEQVQMLTEEQRSVIAPAIR